MNVPSSSHPVGCRCLVCELRETAPDLLEAGDGFSAPTVFEENELDLPVAATPASDECAATSDDESLDLFLSDHEELSFSRVPGFGVSVVQYRNEDGSTRTFEVFVMGAPGNRAVRGGSFLALRQAVESTFSGFVRDLAVSTIETAKVVLRGRRHPAVAAFVDAAETGEVVPEDAGVVDVLPHEDASEPVAVFENGSTRVSANRIVRDDGSTDGYTVAFELTVSDPSLSAASGSLLFRGYTFQSLADQAKDVLNGRLLGDVLRTVNEAGRRHRVEVRQGTQS